MSTETECTDTTLQNVDIPTETLTLLKEAFETAKESERQFQLAQLQAEAKISKWQFVLVNTMRELDVPKCYSINFNTGQFEPLPAETATVQ